MTLRSPRERVLQTAAFEIGGLMLVTPAFVAITGHSSGEGLLLLVVLSVTAVLWSPLHNTVFDWADWQLNRRLASDRPHRLRIVHAISHEASMVCVTLPIVMLLGGLDLGAAIAVEIGLTLAYTGWAYLFHLGYDRLRPMQAAGRQQKPAAGRAIPTSGPALSGLSCGH
jgi:uncharacterized membrane protein